ncbi:DUF2867 domain-containing protein [Pseudoalteromonas rubra]|uniref:DUF2867 domain-containing protein n=1 Tax=Pseudoalteromonas rubra TaxID=43658 RepID=A0A5S3WML4_9GAMM|nr:DUF2867 domain-containing protein [Pseudoalteromonas rubra]TMP28235.1 DUF2867 domain-containing protein [Pseudoalteromonas rubra]TMP34937.1 DUF2867 domain-containing protein [Pseudoalteromonas rubra]
MFSQIMSLTSVPDRLQAKACAHHFRDALQVTLDTPSLTPSQLQYRIFNTMPGWVSQLMRLRNKLVAAFGFSVGQSTMVPASDELDVGDQAGFLNVCEKYPEEIISSAEDRHMTFYLSVKKQQNTVIVSTLVNPKTLTGRIYLTAILPFHHIIARSVIHNAKKAGRL